MTDPISIHNVPAQLDLAGRPKWDKQKRNPKRHHETTGGENVIVNDDSARNNEHPPAAQRRGSDGSVGTQVDVEA